MTTPRLTTRHDGRQDVRMKGAWCWALLCLAAACLLCHAGAAADDRETAGDQMNTIGDDDEKYLGTDIFDNTIEGTIEYLFVFNKFPKIQPVAH